MIAHLIESEPVLSGRVLKLANSAYYGASTKKISSLTIAITRLGHRMIRELVYSLEVTKLFRKDSIIDHQKFWRHSLAVAVFTQAMSRMIKCSAEEQEMAYLAGLMHDIGVMVFAFLLPKEYEDFAKSASDKEISLHKQEKDFFSIDHAELGARFTTKWWNINETVIETIRKHHFPITEDHNQLKLAQLVDIANSICNNQGITNGIDVYTDPFSEGAWIGLGLEIDMVGDILEEVTKSIEKAELLLKNAS